MDLDRLSNGLLYCIIMVLCGIGTKRKKAKKKMSVINYMLKHPMVSSQRKQALFQPNYSTFFDVAAAEKCKSPQEYTKIKKRYAKKIDL